MHQIVIGNKTYEAPSQWSDCTPKQMRKAIAIVYDFECMREVQLLDLFRLFVPISNTTFKQLSEDTLFELCDCFKFVLDTFPEQVFFKEINGNYLPHPRMEFSSIAEFAIAEQYFEAFKTLKDKQYLYLLLATLCRPLRAKKLIDSSGDIRIPCDTQKITANAERMAKMKDTTALLVLHYYLGCRQYIFETYSKVYDSSESATDENFVRIPYDMWDMIRDAAKTGLYGNYENTLHTNLHLILSNLNKERIIAIAQGKNK